jgi:two-component system sensor histidine kinase RpfC
MSRFASTFKAFAPGALASNLSRTAASEYEQGVIRVLIIIVVLSSMAYQVWQHGWAYPFDMLIPVVAGYLVFSIGLMCSFLRWKDGSTPRRTTSMVLDIGITTFSAWHAYEQLFAMFWIYQWLAIGYGARYGRRYLLGAVVLAAGGFGLVSWRGGYLGVESGLGAEGVIVALVLIPLFVASLIGKIERARREAEEANRAKSQFLANMSHEMRTPLYGVVGSASLMDPSRLDAEHRECVETIIASAQTLESVIEDVLDLSKIEAGKTTLDLVECDLRQVVRSTVRMLQHQAESKGLALDVSLADGVPAEVRVDAQHLRQVLVNLVGNAIKFTESGHVDVRVSRRDDTQSGVRILFEVMDTGIGISAAAQTRIFESFTQADDSTTRRFGGTGLGTTIAKQLIELMGGEIGVDSQLDHGSRFWFTLPVEVLAQSGRAPVPLGQRDVLVVSSNAAAQQSLCSRIAPWVASVRASATQAQALARLVSERRRAVGPPALVVIDCGGFEAADALVAGIRGEPELCDTTILAISDEPVEHVDLQVPCDVDPTALYRVLQGAEQREESGIAVLRASPEPGTVQALRVLVVDDQAVNRRLVSRILERAGHRPTLADSGEAALEVLQPGRFDAVVIDMMMPTLSGLDVMRMYRYGAGLGDDLPFLVLSGNATVDAHRECEEAGADGFLTKPVDREVLVSTVESAAQGTGGPAPRRQLPH